MNLFGYILFGFAMGLNAMLVMRNSASRAMIPLTRGLLNALIIAFVDCVLLLFGIWLSSLWTFQLGDVDKYIFLGIILLLVGKMLIDAFSKQHNNAGYDIAKMGTTLLLAVALGLDSLIGGMGFGFLNDISSVWLKAALPLFVLVFLLAYLGVMFGRRQVVVRQRRWSLIAVLFVLAVAFIGLS